MEDQTHSRIDALFTDYEILSPELLIAVNEEALFDERVRPCANRGDTIKQAY